MEDIISIKKIWTDRPADLIDKLKRIKSSVKNSVSYYVFKCSRTLILSLSSDEKALIQICDRSDGKPVYIIEFDVFGASHHIHKINNSEITITNNSDLLKQIRQRDLLDVIHQNSGDCILDAPKGSHFITPSNKHTTRFLRVADALHSYNAIDRISYWLQPHLANSCGVLIDSWPLSSIVLRTQQQLGRDIPFDSFKKHVNCDETLAIETLNKFSKKIIKDAPLVILLSISSSGLFFKKIKQLISQTNIKNEIFYVSIFKFKDAPTYINTLSTLDFDIEWYNSDDCKFCNNGERPNVHHIDPKFYYPRLYNEEGVNFSERFIKNSDTSEKHPFVRFFEMYGLIPKALRLHRDDPNDGIMPRHHAFYIDVSALLEDDAFIVALKAKLIEAVSGKENPNLVITPPHEAGEKLALLANELWGCDSISSHALIDLSVDERLLITSSTHICIMDDVVITGSRFTKYVRSLREKFSGIDLEGLREVTWLPVIVRPDDINSIRAMKDKLSHHPWVDSFIPMHTMILPNWNNEKDCPWCEEGTIFTHLTGAVWDEPEWYQKRMRSLVYGKTCGIMNDPLLLFPGAPRNSLGGGSPLASDGSSVMQLIFILSSALQVFRNDHETPLGRGLLTSYVISSTELFERFSEPLVQAVFLRLVKCNEWRADTLSEGFGQLANSIDDVNRDERVGEVLLFLQRYGSSNSLATSMKDLLTKIKDDDPVIARLVVD